MKNFKIKVPIYKVIIEGYTRDSFLKEFVDYFEEKDIENYDAFCTFDPRNKTDIVFVFEPGAPLDVIVHESVHIVNMIFNICGVQLDLENDETQAYLTQYIFKELTAKIYSD